MKSSVNSLREFNSETPGSLRTPRKPTYSGDRCTNTPSVLHDTRRHQADTCPELRRGLSEDTENYQADRTLSAPIGTKADFTGISGAHSVIFGAIFQIFRGKSLKTGANPELQKIIAPRHALPRIALRGAVGGKKFMERDVGAILKFSGFSRFVAVL